MKPHTPLEDDASVVPLRLVRPSVDSGDSVEDLVRRVREHAAQATAAKEVRGEAWFDALTSAEERARKLAEDVEVARGELSGVQVALEPGTAEARGVATPLLARLTLDAGIRYGVLGALALLLCFMVWAGVTDYALRVTSDTPTFIALVTGMAGQPFAEQSPFLGGTVATQHATPYMQSVAFLWSFLSGDSNDPVQVSRLLAFVGIPIFGLLLLSVFLYCRRLAGSRAAWLSLPVLLLLFGPAHVIWASDLTFHGALYASYFPQNLALALLVLTVLALDGKGRVSLALACLGAAATMLAHPFTGVLLCVLVTAQSSYLAYRRQAGFERGPIALAVGFGLGSAWPAYSLDRAFSETGLRGVVLVSLCVLIPIALWRLSTRSLPKSITDRLRGLLEHLTTHAAAYWLALAGALGTVLVVVSELWLLHAPPADSARLAIYWVDDRWRWPLLLCAGAVGLVGLARLALRGQLVPAVWFSGAFAVGVLGALGLPLPVWYRFLLLCQIPLAIGVAVVLSRGAHARTVAIVLATFALAFCVKLGTLLATPATVSYFGSELQPVWALGEHVPRGPGVVATDPKTAYFIPAATGHRVLTVDKAHVSSARELAVAEDGYQLLRRFYAGGPDWWQAAQEMWRRGVRLVLVEKNTTLQPATLADFTWQSSMLTTDRQKRGLSRYFYENNRVGRLLYDSPDYVLYALDPRKLGVQSLPASSSPGP